MLNEVSRQDRLAAVAVFVVAVLAGVHAVGAWPLGVFYDDAHYVILAKSLATGEGYRYLNLPGAPAGTHFPPGYPAFLALLWKLAPEFPENVAAFRMANVVLLGVVGVAVYWLARTRLKFSSAVAAFAAVASTVTVPPLLLSSNIMSETLFLALLIPLLLLAERRVEKDGLIAAASLGVATAALCLVRTHGVVLIPAIALGYGLHRRWRESSALVIAAVLALLPWLLWVQHFDPQVPEPFRGQYGSYSGWLVEGLRDEGLALLTNTIHENIVTTAVVLARSFSITTTPVFDALAVTAVIGLAAAGSVDLGKRARITLSFTLLYIAMTLAWPFSPLRFLWGIWPLLVILLIAGARLLWAVRLPRWNVAPRVAAIAFGVPALAGCLAFNVRGYSNAWWDTPARDARGRVLAHVVWVAENTKPTDVIASTDEAPVYLYTGRRGVPVARFTARQFVHARTRTEDALHLARVVRQFSPTYVLAWTVPTQEAASILAAPSRRLLSQVDTIPNGLVFRTNSRSGL